MKSAPPACRRPSPVRAARRPAGRRDVAIAPQRAGHPHRRPALGRAGRCAAGTGRARPVSVAQGRRTSTAWPQRGRALQPTRSAPPPSARPAAPASSAASTPTPTGCTNNFTEYPAALKSFPMTCCRPRLRDRLHRQVAHGRGQRRAAPRLRPLDVSHQRPGQATSTPSSTSTAGAAKSSRATTPPWSPTTPRSGSPPARSASRGCLILGHKAPHGGPIQPEPRFEHALDERRFPGNYRRLHLQPDGKPAWLAESLPTWHGAGGPLYGRKESTAPARSPP
jgi:hypothetical protein